MADTGHKAEPPEHHSGPHHILRIYTIHHNHAAQRIFFFHLSAMYLLQGKFIMLITKLISENLASILPIYKKNERWKDYISLIKLEVEIG